MLLGMLGLTIAFRYLIYHIWVCHALPKKVDRLELHRVKHTTLIRIRTRFK